MSKMLEKLKKFPLNVHDIWKLLALILMTVDHYGSNILNDDINFRTIGRLAFPIFAAIYGYHFKNKINYSLLIYGLPILILNYMFYDYLFFNILYSFFIASFLLKIFNEKISNNIVMVVILLFLIPVSFILSPYLEYGLFAFFFMLSANQNKSEIKIPLFLLTFLSYFLIQSTYFGLVYPNVEIFFILLSIEGYMLYRYKNNSISLKNIFIGNTIKILSRYSLQIYVLQDIFFQLLHKFTY